MKLQLHSTELFKKIHDAKTRNVVLEGGARSSKTWSVLQYFIVDAFESKKPKEYDIVRETLPALKASAMKDFEDILKSNGLYHEENHNKSENIYTVHGSHFNFYSANPATAKETKKLRGRKRDKILLNEANEMTLDTYRQVAMRTTEQVVLDYNPSEEESWIYDHIIPRKDCTFLQSTYKDNPFLEQSIIDEIELLKDDDPEYWTIYGLGRRGKRSGIIFPNYRIVPSFPENCKDILYGMDFGFNDPKVVVKLGRVGKQIFVHQLLYKRGMIREEFIPELKKLIPYESRSDEYYADSADPESIEAIYRAGFNIHPADKSKDSVLTGIEAVKAYELCITAESIDVQKDVKNYKWKKDKNGIFLDVPIHAFSHACDAIRYPVFTHWSKEYKYMTSKDMKEVNIEEMEAITVAEGY
jgi:phage terminase large subunit